MRLIFMCITAICLSISVSAKCSFNGIWLTSGNGTLNKNGWIIIEFYGGSQDLVPGINKKYPVFMQTKSGQKVQLLVQEVLRGEFQLTQVILKPAAELTVNETYEIRISNLPKHESLKRYNAITRAPENVTVVVTNTVDKQNPVFVEKPQETKKTMVSYGCGPARWVHFSLSGKDESEFFVRVIVTNKLTGKKSEYIVKVENNTVRIGHGMCSGAFHFGESFNYEARFALVDQSGNMSEWSAPVDFSKPVVETAAE